MNNDQIKEIMNRFNTAMEFSEDVIAYNRCKNILKNYVRFEAITHIQTLINRYKSEINQFGFLIDRVHVIYGIDYANFSDFQIKDQLIYIGQRIPVYAFIREGEKKLADVLLNKIGLWGFDTYNR